MVLPIEHLNSVPFYHYFSRATRNGQKAVDLFFMLSGLFYAITYSPALTTGKFLLKKIIRLYPVFLFCLAVYYILTLFSSYKFFIWNALLNIFGFNCTTYVIGDTGHLGVFWYASTMTWVLLLLHYSLKCFDKDKIKLAAGTLAFLIYGFIISSHHGKINSPTLCFHGIVTMGMLRGLAGISVGYIIGDWYKNNIKMIKDWDVCFSGKLLMSFVTMSCLYFIIKYMIFVKWTFKNDTLFLVAFILLIVLFLLNKDFISRLLNNNIWGIFSKYTYSIYISHIVVIAYLKAFLLMHSIKFMIKHPIFNFSMIMTSVILFGVIIYHLVEKPCASYLRKRWLS